MFFWYLIVCYVLFSLNCDNLVIIWYVRIGKLFINLNGVYLDMINNESWNQYGSQIFIVFKDKKVRKIDFKKLEVVVGKERV